MNPHSLEGVLEAAGGTVALLRNSQLGAHLYPVVVPEKLAGFSLFTGYSYNERSMLSLAIVDPEIEIRAIVSPLPYSKVAREEYAKGWRMGSAWLHRAIAPVKVGILRPSMFIPLTLTKQWKRQL